MLLFHVLLLHHRLLLLRLPTGNEPTDPKSDATRRQENNIEDQTAGNGPQVKVCHRQLRELGTRQLQQLKLATLLLCELPSGV